MRGQALRKSKVVLSRSLCLRHHFQQDLPAFSALVFVFELFLKCLVVVGAPKGFGGVPLAQPVDYPPPATGGLYWEKMMTTFITEGGEGLGKTTEQEEDSYEKQRQPWP